jgi:hypothetical protein
VDYQYAYLDAENTPAYPESDLELFVSTDNGASWWRMGKSAQDMTADWIQQNGLDPDGIWTLSDCPVINFTVLVIDEDCPGATDGSIEVTAASGGLGPYEYSHDGGTTWGTDPLFAGLTPGSYPIQVRDASGCLSPAVSYDIQGGIDNTPPTVLCQNLTVQLDATGNATITAMQIDNGSTDHCGIQSLALDQSTFDCTDVGINQVTLTVTDVNGNSASCTSNVTVEDNLAPVALCQNLTVQLNASGMVLITPNQVDNGSYDNCGVQSLILDNNVFTCADIGTQTVNLTVVDVNGNFTICTATVTVEDIQVPVFTYCPANIELCGEQTVSWTEPTATDNCPSLAISGNYAPGDVFAVGTTTVVYTAKDMGGNEETCSFDVTIHPLPVVDIVQSGVPEFCQGLATLTADVLNESSLLAPLTYTWTNGLGNDPSVIIQENGSFSLTVTDDRGCSATESISVNLIPSDITAAYTLLAKDGISFHQSTLSSGGAGVMKANKKAMFKQSSVVSTFVKAPVIQVQGGSTVASQIQGKASVTLPAFQSPNNPNGPDLTVPQGQTLTISGNNYEKIEVEKNATLIFANPEVSIEEFEVEKGASVEFLQSTVLKVEDEVKLDKNVLFNLSGEMVTVFTKDKFKVKEGSTVITNVFAKQDIQVDNAKAANPTSMNGLFISNKKIVSGKYVEWNGNPNCDPEPASAAPQVASYEGDPGEMMGDEPSLRAYPNPFSDKAVIEVQLPEAGTISLIVFDLNGKPITEIFEGEANLGNNQYELSAHNLATGIYMIRLTASERHYYERILVKH